jgi:uroporphyrinogen III methyltransferase/synthase
VTGFVSLVGAGPWNPELLTLAGRERLSRADVVIADYLVNPAMFVHCRPDAKVIQRQRGPKHGARILQKDIDRMLLEHAKAGSYVVRLKGGDPCVFGRGGEEAELLYDHGIPFELVPGVSSSVAAPESAGIPITHRDHTPAVTFVSGFEAYDKAGLEVQWKHLARSAGTIVMMMGVGNLRDNARRLIESGRLPDTPAAMIRWGTRGVQRTLVGTLDTIADIVERDGLRPPAVLVVGEVVGLRAKLAWLDGRPLFGRRVVVTRSVRQAGTLIQMLAARGADVAHVPCLEIVPPRDFGALDRALSRIREEHDGLLLTSPNGVSAVFDALARVGLDARALAGVQIAVVGPGTAEACRERHVTPDLVATKRRSEGLVEVLEQHDLLAKRWLHVRSEEGRAVLGEAITAAGGRYDLVVGYCTRRPDLPPLLLDSLRRPENGGEGMDAICLTSGETGKGFLEIMREALGEQEAEACVDTAKIVTIGPVTTAAVEALGLRVDATADEASDEGMLQAVLDVLGGSPGTDG